jgi:hypothetical protein
VDERPLWKKLAWFFLLWAGGVGTATAVGYAVKRAMATVMQF